MERPNGVSACASCKHQRKKCTEKCILAPFFPVERSQEFRAVRKVFGVSNVAKTLKYLNHEERKKAAEALIWEASCWQRDPVNGPYGEHRRVFEELNLYKNRYFQTRGSMVYQATAAPSMIGRNNKQTSGGIYRNGGIISSITDDNNRSSVFHAYSYGIDHYLHNINLEKQWPENDRQEYCVPGPYHSNDAKTNESSMWEGDS